MIDWATLHDPTTCPNCRSIRRQARVTRIIRDVLWSTIYLLLALGLAQVGFGMFGLIR